MPSPRVPTIGLFCNLDTTAIVNGVRIAWSFIDTGITSGETQDTKKEIL